jgi:hypothetical protein
MSAQEFLENKIFSEDVSVHGDSSHKADAKALWKKVLGELEIIIAPASFKMWLLKVAPGEIKENYKLKVIKKSNKSNKIKSSKNKSKQK